MTTVLSLHNKFRGDATATAQKIAKNGSTATLNSHVAPQLQQIKTTDLVPLESQRTTNDRWTVQRLKALGGLDMWAFGALSVCHDTRDGKNYVWDGCGRLALAQLHQLDQVPCLVVEGNKEDAAFYFGYCQDSSQGRRTLSKEVLFVNRYFSGDKTAIQESEVLSQLGLFVQGDTSYSVPQPLVPGHVEIGYRAFHEGFYTIADADDSLPITDPVIKNKISLVRQARDMIVTAWSHNASGCNYINQDIFWALLFLFKVYPEVRTGVMNTRLQQFLNYVAMGQDQKHVKWKAAGLSGNSGVAGQLAFGLLKAWKNTSNFYKTSDSGILTYKKLRDFNVDTGDLQD